MTLVTPANLFWAVYAAVVFALILGIRDLVIVNRRTAYQLLVFLISFAGCLLLFGKFSAWSAPTSFLSLAILSLGWLWLLRGVPDKKDTAILPLAIAALILFEIGIAMFLLPINFFAKSALLFLGSALLFEAAINLKRLTFKRALVWGGSYAAITLLVVFLASWKV